MLFLISCGNSSFTSNPVGPSKGAAVSKTAASPEVSLKSILAVAEKGRYKEGEIIVKFKSGVLSSQSVRTHQSVGAAALGMNMERVKLPAGVGVKDAIAQYMQDPGVEYAEPNYIRYPSAIPNDTFFDPQQWSLNNTGTYAAGIKGADIKATQAWDITTGSAGVVIAVIDSGIDYNHADLVRNLWINPNETNNNDGIDHDNNGYKNDFRGWDFAGNNNDPMDELGHGTHVAGIIGAQGNNGIGIAGVMWNVSMMPLKFIVNQGTDICGSEDAFCGTVADEVAAIQYAVANGAKIINASYVSNTFSQAEFDAIKAAGDAGVLMVAAAGNGDADGVGDNNDLNPHYPASCNLPNIISVAATDQKDEKVGFSNYGPNSVHVGAPGVYILSTVPHWWTEYEGYGFIEFLDGTSMAAPHVTGLAGLLYSYYPNFTYSQVRGTILRYVDTLPTLQGWIQTGGRINAYKALSSLLAPTNLTVTDRSSSSISLSWTDNAAGEDGYDIYRSSDGATFEKIATIGADSTSFTDSGLSGGTTYTYRVAASNTIPANSPFSNDATATTTGSIGGSSSSGGGGGGGCSIAGPKTPSGTGDLVLALIPLAAVLGILRRKSFKLKRR